jgi:hypothetical protein
MFSLSLWDMSTAAPSCIAAKRLFYIENAPVCSKNGKNIDFGT